MIRISKVTLKDWPIHIKVRRQQICEGGEWKYAVFERKHWINNEFVPECWVRIR